MNFKKQHLTTVERGYETHELSCREPKHLKCNTQNSLNTFFPPHAFILKK
jgi:hypothetical protein